MRGMLVGLLVLGLQLHAQVSIVSWNLCDFGKTKSDAEITFIAKQIKNFDIVAIQEIVAGDPGGAQAVARLYAALDLTGSAWDYRISDPTSGTNGHKKERYAYLWKPSKAKLIGKPWLEIKYKHSIEREPYLATFEVKGKQFTLVNFHAKTATQQPELEVAQLALLLREYLGQQLVFAGDFNLPVSARAFAGLKNSGYVPALSNQKTSLKQSCDGTDCLANEYDNILFPATYFTLMESGIQHFYRLFTDLTDARKISDHVPVWVVVR